MSIDHTIDEESLIAEDIHAFLDRNQQKELLRFVTVGSVDDGKSTLIGRLLHDTKGVYDDQLKDATLTSSTGETAIDFARIIDGLRAEREQGITLMWLIDIFRHLLENSSSRTHLVTFNTRVTWPPVHPLHTSH